MDRTVFVYTTYPSAVEAEKAGQALVGERLAACVNILPGMISVYRWQGAVERADEAVMIVKTRASLAEPVCAAVKAGHPYDTRPSWSSRSRASMSAISPGYSPKRRPPRRPCRHETAPGCRS